MDNYAIVAAIVALTILVSWLIWLETKCPPETRVKRQTHRQWDVE